MSLLNCVWFQTVSDISQLGSGSTVVTPRFSDNKHFNVTVPSDPPVKLGEPSFRSSETSNARETSRSNSLVQADDHCNEAKDPSQVDSMDGSPERAESSSTLHNCGLLPNSLLPCLACSASSEEKNKAAGPHSPIVKKRLSIKLSFKKKEGLAHSSISKYLYFFLHWYCK